MKEYTSIEAEYLECNYCDFVEVEGNTLLETSETLYTLEDEPYEVFCLKCPKCGKNGFFEFDKR